MIRTVLLIALAAGLAACTEPRPTAGASVGTEGDVRAGVGVEGDRVAVGVNTDGDVGARVDVVETGNASVSVGTGGASASVRPGGGPVRFGIGRGGLRVGI
ncbi:MAG: hypothetical protein AAFU80_18190 [Pseudomonadota bacterium]